MIEKFVVDTINILTDVQSLREYAAFAQVKGNNAKYKTIETVKKQETSEKKMAQALFVLKLVILQCDNDKFSKLSSLSITKKGTFLNSKGVDT